VVGIKIPQLRANLSTKANATLYTNTLCLDKFQAAVCDTKLLRNNNHV